MLEDGLLSDDLTHNPLEVVSDEVPHNEFAAEGSGEEHAVADPSKAAKCKEKCNPCKCVFPSAAQSPRWSHCPAYSVSVSSQDRHV